MNDDLDFEIENLCLVLKNQSIETSEKIRQIVNYDIEKMTKFYFLWLENQENIEFIIDPLPELDMYIDEEICAEMVKYISNENKGVSLMVDSIKSKYPCQNPPIAVDIIETMLNYYCDYLLQK